MSLPEHMQRLIPIADDQGISLYQRFSAAEAAEFLRVPGQVLASLCAEGEMAFIRMGQGEVQFFGYQLLEYLVGHTAEVNRPAAFPADSERIIRAREVCDMAGLSRATIWRREKAGTFPARVSLGGNSVGWKYSEVQRWMSERESL